jgi:hypothetical protein
MRKLSYMLAGMMISVWGCASMQSGQSSPGPTGVPSQPVITRSYASEKIRLGDTWKAYINASDPGGAMKYIVVTVSQFGSGGAYPVSYIRIKGENSREFSGYVYLNTSQNLHQGLHFTNITLTAEVKSKTGKTSEPVTFPLHFSNEKQAPPPQGVFQEKELGPIMITIEPANKMD